MSKRMMAMVVAVALSVVQPAFGPAVHAQAREGITVHGHWVIDVRNSDGTLASHMEIENALLQQGAESLATLLSKTAVVRGWAVNLHTGNGRPFGGDSNSGLLYEAVVAPGYLNPNDFTGLTVAQVNSTVVLKGTATTVAAGQITSVATRLTLDSHGEYGSSYFSGTDFPNPVVLAAGQIVQVTVTLSFS